MRRKRWRGEVTSLRGSKLKRNGVNVPVEHSRAIKMRYILIVVLVAILSLNGCSKDEPQVIAYKYLRQISGENAIDCGYVRFGDNAAVTNQCVVNAYKKHQPFVARYDVEGVDSRLIFGLAGDGTEKVVSVKYDGEGWEPPSREGASLVGGNHVLITPCPTPVNLHSIKPGSYLSCYD